MNCNCGTPQFSARRDQAPELSLHNNGHNDRVRELHLRELHGCRHNNEHKQLVQELHLWNLHGCRHHNGHDGSMPRPKLSRIASIFTTICNCGMKTVFFTTCNCGTRTTSTTGTSMTVSK